MIEPWAPVIGAGVIVLGAAVVQLHIYRRTAGDKRKDRERKRLNAVKDLYWGLLMMSAQAWFKDSKATSVDPWLQFFLYPEDISWLRRHFHENAHLFSPNLHKQYRKDITGVTTRPRLVPAEGAPAHLRKFVVPGPVFGANLWQLSVAVMDELKSLDPDADLSDMKFYVPKRIDGAPDSSGDGSA